jgi:hypothetical protein
MESIAKERLPLKQARVITPDSRLKWALAVEVAKKSL